jgi:hypothetical protein
MTNLSIRNATNGYIVTGSIGHEYIFSELREAFEYIMSCFEGLSEDKYVYIWRGKIAKFCAHGHNGQCPVCDAMQTPPIKKDQP